VAETDQEQKTEEATPKRREKAREEGRVTQSPDLVFAVLTLSAAATLALSGSAITATFRDVLTSAIAMFRPELAGDVGPLARAVPVKVVTALLPLFVVLFAAAAVSALFQIGWHPVPNKLSPKFDKLVPNFDPSRFISVRSITEMGMSVLKFIALAGVGTFFLKPDVMRLLEAADSMTVASRAFDLLLHLMFVLGLMMLAIGALDYVLKHRQLEKDLRMTKEEVKQEAKDASGDPEIKARIRRRQREVAMQRMMDDVPKASVVITNPTHFAVALKYESGQHAPKVVAKGADFIALKIRELAKAANVPLVENPPLARALYGSVEIGDEIPPTLYQAVAEVLAAIFRAKHKLGRSA
jgi:flagellar biosynthetic protein FlhB